MFSLFKPNTVVFRLTAPWPTFTLHTDRRPISISSSHSQTESKELYFPKCRTIRVQSPFSKWGTKMRQLCGSGLTNIDPHKNNKSCKNSSKTLKYVNVTDSWNMKYAKNSLKHIASIVASKDFMDPGVNPSSACLHRCFYSFWLIIMLDWHLLSCLIHCTWSCYKKACHDLRLSVQTNRITISLLCYPYNILKRGNGISQVHF